MAQRLHIYQEKHGCIFAAMLFSLIRIISGLKRLIQAEFQMIA